MVEFRIKVNPEQRLAYIPKELYEAMGSNLKATPNRGAVLLYPEKMPVKDILKSVDIIRQDLEHSLELSKEKGS
jgi:hypothetical protein